MGRATLNKQMAASKTRNMLALSSSHAAFRGLALIAVMCQFVPCLSAMYDRPAFVGLSRILPLGTSQDNRRLSMCMSSPPRDVPLGRFPLRMDRKDGGSEKISRPSGPGKIGNPNTPGGAGVGDREAEKGGAGVAVLTKPPETDKV